MSLCQASIECPRRKLIESQGVLNNALVDYYCCFNLTSGTSTAVGPSIVHRNRKRFLLSQSTLREEFVEKKYEVFDIIGLLTILVQVNFSSPVERV